MAVVVVVAAELSLLISQYYEPLSSPNRNGEFCQSIFGELETETVTINYCGVHFTLNRSAIIKLNLTKIQQFTGRFI